jgi:hypothetical protein
MYAREYHFHKKHLFIIKAILVCGASFFINLAPGLAWSDPLDYWPTEAWRISSPESQGMDSNVLADMLKLVMYESNSIDSITVYPV